jgi:hypothetical protein
MENLEWLIEYLKKTFNFRTKYQNENYKLFGTEYALKPFCQRIARCRDTKGQYAVQAECRTDRGDNGI